MSADAPYQPPVDQPPTLPPPAPYGGFWIRFAAYFVDSFIIGFGIFAITIPATIALAVSGAGEFGPLFLWVTVIALTQVYHAYFVSSKRMATPGKRLCGLYVTDTSGHRLSFGRALWRNVAALLSYATLYIGFNMAGFTGRKQALHDMLAGTIVHRQPSGSAGMAIGIAVAGFIVVAIIGILAAIAIPAYQDFTWRAKSSAVYAAMSATKTPIAEYNLEKNAWPATWEQAGVTDPMSQLGAREREVAQSIRLGKDGEVTASVKFSGASGEIRITPKRTGDGIVWTCTASKEIWKYIAAACRN